MKKIPTIFKRNPDNMKEVLNEINPVCQWVFDGEGVATRKYDGTCCLVHNGRLYKRREIKKGKPLPAGFQIADRDEITGKTVGWIEVDDSKENKWHLEAFDGQSDGTYELLGPKIQGNPEGYEFHVLLPHAAAIEYVLTDRSFTGIKEFLEGEDIEGIVFHHPDGRMAKIKKRDFGLRRN